MKIKNKDIILSTGNGEYQKISFISDSTSAAIWYDDVNEVIMIDGAINAVDIDSDSSSVALSHNKLSDLNVAPYIHLNQTDYDNLTDLTNGSLITNLHWHETVNGHKITVNLGALPSSNAPFDIHIVIEEEEQPG